MAEPTPLPIEPLTRAAFAPFGDVIETDGAQTLSINEGTTTRFHDLAAIDVASGGGTPLLSIARAEPRSPPILVRMLERHPFGSQAFHPLGGGDWLVVVAEGGARPDLATMRCFHAGGQQGINYRLGTWHHPLLALTAQDYLVVDRGGPGENLEEVWFEDAADHRTIAAADIARLG